MTPGQLRQARTGAGLVVAGTVSVVAGACLGRWAVVAFSAGVILVGGVMLRPLLRLAASAVIRPPDEGSRG